MAGKFQTSKDEEEGSSIQTPQRGGFRGGRFNARGRGRNREVKCYTCGEIGHMSWEFPENKTTSHRNANIVEAHEEFDEEAEMNNPTEEGESLMMKIFLVKTEKKVHEPTQRKSRFRNKCKSQGKCCKMVFIVVVQIIWPLLIW